MRFLVGKFYEFRPEYACSSSGVLRSLSILMLIEPIASFCNYDIVWLAGKVDLS